MLRVTITTAHPLSAAHFKEIKQAVEKKYGTDVTFEKIVDESVIGGLRLVVGTTEVDGTVRGKIQKIKHSLVNK